MVKTVRVDYSKLGEQETEKKTEIRQFSGMFGESKHFKGWAKALESEIKRDETMRQSTIHFF